MLADLAAAASVAASLTSAVESLVAARAVAAEGSVLTALLSTASAATARRHTVGPTGLAELE